MKVSLVCFVFFQAEDGIRDLVRSRGLGDVYKRQVLLNECQMLAAVARPVRDELHKPSVDFNSCHRIACLLYTSDAADERSSVDLGGRRIIKKKTKKDEGENRHSNNTQTESCYQCAEEAREVDRGSENRRNE